MGCPRGSVDVNTRTGFSKKESAGFLVSDEERGKQT
jgi:hypothetical protein